MGTPHYYGHAALLRAAALLWERGHATLLWTCHAIKGTWARDSIMDTPHYYGHSALLRARRTIKGTSHYYGHAALLWERGYATLLLTRHVIMGTWA